MLLSVSERKILDDVFFGAGPEHIPGAALRDVFVLGCILYSQGEAIAGEKAIWSALTATGLDKSNHALYAKLLDSISGNEPELIDAMRARSEFNSLMTPRG